jgi:cell division protease FtsH
VGADLENLVNEAALFAARQDKDMVSMIDFELAKDKVLMGAERRSMVIPEEERKNTAVHEAGHALVAVFVKGCDPVHKVTIIPRGPTLGLTQTLPKQDHLNLSPEQLRARIALMMGGRVAEEIVFGEYTTGAGNDIKQASNLARRMVTEFGMSEVLGPISYASDEESVFLGRDFTSRSRNYSESVARQIDDEVHKLVMEGYERARTVLTEKREVLDRLAAALLERETIHSEEMIAVVDNRDLPVKSKIVIPTYADREKAAKEKRRTASIFGAPKPVPGT